MGGGWWLQRPDAAPPDHRARPLHRKHPTAATAKPRRARPTASTPLRRPQNRGARGARDAPASPRTPTHQQPPTTHPPTTTNQPPTTHNRARPAPAPPASTPPRRPQNRGARGARDAPAEPRTPTHQQAPTTHPPTTPNQPPTTHHPQPRAPHTTHLPPQAPHRGDHPLLQKDFVVCELTRMGEKAPMTLSPTTQSKRARGDHGLDGQTSTRDVSQITKI